jgi:acetyl-CoA C-acetyltransferase
MSHEWSVAVLGLARTPFGRFGGALRNVDIRDLGAATVAEAIARSGVATDDIDEAILGVNFPGSRRSVARQAALRAGLRESLNAITVDRACCSSLTAIRFAVRGIRSGDTNVAVAGGAENLSQVPYFIEQVRFGHGLGPIVLEDHLVISCPHTGVPRAVQASDEAAGFAIGREEQDEWAFRSHEKYWHTYDSGPFAEIFPVDEASLPGAEQLSADESPRRDSTVAKLAMLPTIYGSKTVTAGNAPGLSTGASALVVASNDFAESSRAPNRVLARLVAFGSSSNFAERIGETPAIAARQALARARLSLDDIHVIEINEAFASVPLVATHVLGDGDASTVQKLRDRTNVRGGAIAIGHPTGASGSRLVMSAIAALTERGGGFALVAICGGIAEAEAVVVEVP